MFLEKGITMLATARQNAVRSLFGDDFGKYLQTHTGEKPYILENNIVYKILKRFNLWKG